MFCGKCQGRDHREGLYAQAAYKLSSSSPWTAPNLSSVIHNNTSLSAENLTRLFLRGQQYSWATTIGSALPLSGSWNTTTTFDEINTTTMKSTRNLWWDSEQRSHA
jgi:hypothetical protein